MVEQVLLYFITMLTSLNRFYDKAVTWPKYDVKTFNLQVCIRQEIYCSRKQINENHSTNTHKKRSKWK